MIFIKRVVVIYLSIITQLIEGDTAQLGEHAYGKLKVVGSNHLRASLHPEEFFLNQKHFSFFLIAIFRSIYLQYGHIWYQNDSNEKFYQMISFIFKYIYN